MNPLDDFLDLLRVWRDRGAPVIFDDDEVRAPHTAVQAFDQAAFADDAGRLTAGADELRRTVTELGALGRELPTVWTGLGGAGLLAANADVQQELTPVADLLAQQAQNLRTASTVLREVLDEYHAVLALAGAPLAAGIVPAAAGEQLESRLDAVRTAGLAAARAVDDSLEVLADDWHSPGELVLAGSR